MTIPDFQSVMRPALDILSDDKVRTLRELRDLVAERMGVTAEEREVLLPSGTQRTFDNRVGWAMSHLAAVGAVSRPSRGNYQITARGISCSTRTPSASTSGFSTSSLNCESSAVEVGGCGRRRPSLRSTRQRLRPSASGRRDPVLLGEPGDAGVRRTADRLRGGPDAPSGAGRDATGRPPDKDRAARRAVQNRGGVRGFRVTYPLSRPKVRRRTKVSINRPPSPASTSPGPLPENPAAVVA